MTDVSQPCDNDVSFHGTPFQQWRQSLFAHLQRHRHRTLIRLQGEPRWRHALIKALLEPWQEAHKTGLWITESEARAPEALPKGCTAMPRARLKQALGQEIDLAVLDLADGIEADALALVGGMIRGGGVCVLGLPAPLRNEPNPALTAFLGHGQSDPGDGFTQWLQQGAALTLRQGSGTDCLRELPDWPAQTTPSNPEPTPQAFRPTSEQEQAWSKIETVALGHRKRPLIIDAPRGRGKSTLLGLAIWRLWQTGKTRLTLTAARPSQIHQAWSFLQRQPDCELLSDTRLQWTNPQNGQRHFLDYRPPDDLVHNRQPSPEVLLIDEAAHLSQALLETLLDTYPRVVMATTTDGYEGSGQGFALKLLPRLRERFDRVFHHTLSTPIRWAPNDPLERQLNERLYLSSSPFSEQTRRSGDAPSVRTWQTAELLTQPNTVNQIMALLSQSHYQHRPNDLMRLLSLPEQSLWTLQQGQQIVGVLWALPEGGLPSFKPGRRFRGHLVAQKLAQLNWDNTWQSLHGWRIQRLAIAPDCQHQQLGTHLLSTFLQSDAAQKKDYVSTSFGATAQLIRFWQRQNFMPMHLGFKRDHASALHSVMMVHAQSDPAKKITTQGWHRFYDEWSWQLAGPFAELPADLLTSLWSLAPPSNEAEAGCALPDYLAGRDFDSLALALRHWTLSQLCQPTWPLDALGQAWLKKVVQNQPWSKALADTDCASRKQLEQAWRSWLARHFTNQANRNGLKHN
ncbi:GNAT family N-acetyltransferase [Thiomicrospira sp. WB1]|uniref:GNAT family N-acetyltransferase n=1 Tax=Thiomicrospira sp. WB1 TaxID=1685380 RepID=UPI000748CFAE|nr:GNAT family N-acetyltransferase [Thiomicrospira sp. WB1]KUJ72553.1 hypothetical protein AVO41_01725 [Thiomicrospira sp. WB1]